MESKLRNMKHKSFFGPISFEVNFITLIHLHNWIAGTSNLGHISFHRITCSLLMGSWKDESMTLLVGTIFHVGTKTANFVRNLTTTGWGFIFSDICQIPQMVLLKALQLATGYWYKEFFDLSNTSLLLLLSDLAHGSYENGSIPKCRFQDGFVFTRLNT